MRVSCGTAGGQGMLSTDKLKNKEDSDDQKSIFDIIEEAEQDPDYYKIDQRPEYIEGVDDKGE